jgi:hypothetical protein
MTDSVPRSLEYLDRRTFNKAVPLQTTTTLPVWYDLFTSEAGQGVIRLFPIPSGAETFQLDYFRRMVIPCTVTSSGGVIFSNNLQITATSFAGATVGSVVSSGTDIVSSQRVVSIDALGAVTLDAFPDDDGTGVTISIGGDSELLDCPEEYVEGIIAWATMHYLTNTAGQPRLDFWAKIAAEHLEKADRSNRDTADAEIMFLPPSVYDNSFLGPNDIRWADYWS